MTKSGLLEQIFERLCSAGSGEEIFGADEAAEWPTDPVQVLIKSGMLECTEPARVIECDGCERNCFMPVHVRPAEGNQLARAFKADKDALLRLVDGDTRQPASGVGSVAWRKETAKAAANARHNQPGGSRDKQRQIREIWATGKYSSRDLCAQPWACLSPPPEKL